MSPLIYNGKTIAEARRQYPKLPLSSAMMKMQPRSTSRALQAMAKTGAFLPGEAVADWVRGFGLRPLSAPRGKYRELMQEARTLTPRLLEKSPVPVVQGQAGAMFKQMGAGGAYIPDNYLSRLAERVLQGARAQGKPIPPMAEPFLGGLGKIHVARQDAPMFDQPGILAHEIGHAQADKSWWGKHLLGSGATIAGTTAPVVSGGLALRAGASDKDEDVLPRLGGAVGVGAAMGAPRFLAEVDASHRGMNLLNELKASDAMKDVARTLYHNNNVVVGAQRFIKPSVNALALGGLAYLGSRGYRALRGEPSKTAMDLQFESPEEVADHMRNREIGGAVGTMGGAAVGALAGGRHFGIPGAVIGSALGGVVGQGPGRMAADLIHDVPQRTESMYDTTRQRLALSGGAGIRIASALPSVTDFLAFAEENEPSDVEPASTGFERDLQQRLRPMGLGHSSSLEGGDDATRNEVMGLPAYSGV